MCTGASSILVCIMPAATDVASKRFQWSSAGYLATEARSSGFHEASKVKPHSVVAHIIYEEMLDALDLNNVANEFVQDIEILNTDKAYFETHAWLPWWMPRLHVPAWGSNHHWAEICFYIHLILKIVTLCLTDLAFLTGPYSGIVQELVN